MAINVKHVEGRICVLVDVNQKNYFTFKDGTVIKLERDVQNLDRGYTQQVLGTVIDAEHVPSGALILFHFNSLHPSNEVLNHKELSGEDIASGIKIYSLPVDECYLWKKDGEWQGIHPFVTGLRVYRPYVGLIEGMRPTKLKNTLYIKEGRYAGKVVTTVIAADHVITFRNENGVDENILKCRDYQYDIDYDRQEIIAVREDLTKELEEGLLYVGLSGDTSEPLNKNVCQNQ